MSGGWRQTYVVVLPVLFMEFMAIGIAATSMPSAVAEFFGQRASFVTGLMATIRGLIGFVTSPALGSLSDAVGRKRLLVACTMATLLPYTTMIVTRNLWVFYSLDLCAAFLSATLPLTYAYISDFDVTERAVVFASAGAALGLALLVGPITGVVLSRTVGWNGVFGMCTAIVLLNFAYMIFVLPESPKSSRKEPVTCARVNPLIPLRLFCRHWTLAKLGLVASSQYLVAAVTPTLLVYLSQRLHFSITDTGIFLAMFGVGDVCFSALGVRVLVRRIGEWRTLTIALSTQMISFIILGLATQKWHVFVSLIFLISAPMGLPNTNAMASHCVPKQEQGTIQGALGGMRALVFACAPATVGFFLTLMQNTKFPGMAYAGCGIYTLGALGIALTLPQTIRELEKLHGHNSNEDALSASAVNLLARDDGHTDSESGSQQLDVLASDKELELRTLGGLDSSVLPNVEADKSAE